MAVVGAPSSLEVLILALTLPKTHVDPVQIERSMSYVSGASFYATRDFIKTVGLMREEYFLYCEDVDWCLRRRNLDSATHMHPQCITIMGVRSDHTEIANSAQNCRFT